MADWKDVAGQLAEIGLPSLGGLIGGMMVPGVGGMLGTSAGKFAASAVAAALGVAPEPAAVASAITANPQDAAVRLATIEAQSRDYAAQLADIASARQMESVAIQASSPIQWAPVFFSVLNYLLFFGIIVGVALHYFREDGIIVGFALGAVTSAYQFWLGSSESSRRNADKNAETVRHVATNSVPAPAPTPAAGSRAAQVLAKAKTL